MLHLVYGVKSREMLGHAFRETNKSRGLFHCRKKIGVTESLRYLSVLISSDGTWNQQVKSAASKANRFLELMKNTFSSWSDKIARIVYSTFDRPHDLNSLHHSTWFLWFYFFFLLMIVSKKGAGAVLSSFKRKISISFCFFSINKQK